MSSVKELPAETRDRDVITTVERNDHRLNVSWADGHESRFHHLWLRDNCFCSECGDTWTGRRYVMLTDFDPDIFPESAEIDAEGNLCVTWSGDSHRSHYDAAWLRRHCYSPKSVTGAGAARCYGTGPSSKSCRRPTTTRRAPTTIRYCISMSCSATTALPWCTVCLPG